MKTRVPAIASVAVLAALVAGASGSGAAGRPFTLADVLSAPYPSNLVAARKADRIAWIMNDRGARNVWTAAAPDFEPVNLTGYVRDEVFEIDEVLLTDDGRTAVFVKGGSPNSAGWVTNSDSGPDGREQAVWAVRTDGGKPWRVAAGSGPVDLAVWVAEAATGQARELWRAPKEAPRFYAFRNFDIAANGLILFTAEREEWSHVFAMPLDGGPPEDITPGDGFVEHLGLSADGATLFFSSNQGDLHGRRVWKVATARGKAVPLTPADAIGTQPVALSSGRGAAFLHATAVRPTTVATVTAAGGKVEAVAPRELPAEFPVKGLVTPQLVVVKAADGLEVPCQLFLAKGAKAGDKRPAVVFTHGGPIRQMLLGWHYMEFYSEAYGINQYFASHGYAVISINFRSGIGYGRSFREAPNCGLEGAAEYQDVLAGVHYLQSRPEVDPERIGAWGLSCGGLLTAMSLARNSDIFKVGVDMAGVHDWSQMGRGRLDEARRKTARESSPVASVNTWRSPVLFIHGDDDRNVDFQQTTDIVQRLRAKGDVEIELMIAPDEPHEFLLYGNRITAYERTFEFIDRHIGKKK